MYGAYGGVALSIKAAATAKAISEVSSKPENDNNQHQRQ